MILLKGPFFFFGAGDVLVSIQELQTKEKEIQKNFPTQRWSFFVYIYICIYVYFEIRFHVDQDPFVLLSLSLWSWDYRHTLLMWDWRPNPVPCPCYADTLPTANISSSLQWTFELVLSIVGHCQCLLKTLLYQHFYIFLLWGCNRSWKTSLCWM